MRVKSIAIWLVAIAATAQAQSYQKIHEQAIVVDTHNDMLSGVVMNGLSVEKDLTGQAHSDLARFKKGGVDVEVFSVFCDERFGKGTAFKYANTEIDSLYALARRNGDKMMIATAPADIQKAVQQKKLAAMIGVEGGHMMEDRLDYLDSFYNRGVRYMTLTWNNSTSWATSAKDETTKKDSLSHKGLTDFGKQVVKHMNALGMMVDLSHVGEQTFWDAISTTTQPVIVSHSCAYALSPVFRNLKDDQIKAVGKNSGVIHINFESGFLDSTFSRKMKAIMDRHRSEVDSLQGLKWSSYAISDWLASTYKSEIDAIRPPLSLLIDHIDYIVKLIGVDHVGLGSDFDGSIIPPASLDDVSCFPLITKALLERGYNKNDIKKILGGNFIRIFNANQQHRTL